MSLSLIHSVHPLLASVIKLQSSLQNRVETPWIVTIDLATLGIETVLNDGTSLVLTSKLTSKPTSEPNDTDVTDLIQTADHVEWKLPKRNLSLSATLTENKLNIKIKSNLEQYLDWPKTGTDPRAVGLAYPESEGLFIPVRDPFWLKYVSAPVCRNTHGGLSMPFWGVHFENVGFAYIQPQDVRSELCLSAEQGKIVASTTHQFLNRDHLPSYEINIVRVDNSPISSALAYRDFLIHENLHVSLSKKILQLPEVEKLLGAFHMYVWGDGRSTEALDDLSKLGIDRALIEYDSDPRTDKFPMTSTLIGKAISMGFIVAPYDTFGMVQSPQSSNMIAAVFDDALFKSGGIQMPNGKRMKGFNGLGYELSSQALKNSPTPFIENRVSSFKDFGVNGYFLDSDACGELYDDFDPKHSMTMGGDLSNKVQRLTYIEKNRKLVLGSECGAAWSVPSLMYADGMETLATDYWWKVYRDKKLFGGWWPDERPPHFFKEIDAPDDLIQSGYNPQYRIPLYQSVFHDSIVVTDRWELSLVKLKNIFKTRSLLALLYNVPSLWNIDRKALKTHGPQMKMLFSFFSPLHRKTGLLPLTQFEWLTPNKLVQRTQFGETLTLTANFSGELYQNIPSMCIQARYTKETEQLYCP